MAKQNCPAIVPHNPGPGSKVLDILGITPIGGWLVEETLKMHIPGANCVVWCVTHRYRGRDARHKRYRNLLIGK
jgi:hypothetical protein